MYIHLCMHTDNLHKNIVLEKNWDAKYSLRKNNRASVDISLLSLSESL